MLKLISFHFTDLTHLNLFLNLQKRDHFTFTWNPIVLPTFQFILYFLPSSEVATKFDYISISPWIGFFLQWTVNEGKSDREAEHMERTVFCTELISSFIIGEKAKPLSKQHFIFNCPPFDSLHSFWSTKLYHLLINEELLLRWKFVAFTVQHLFSFLLTVKP